MEAAETRLVEQLLRSRIGKAAAFRKYDRSLNTPMNFVLDEAQRQLPLDFDVYWIDGGLPELFSLTGLSKPAIVYNSRYIELLYLVRKLVVDDNFASFRQELAERICLRVMAEFALRQGKAEWAVRAFLHSIIGQGFHILDMPGTALLDLEAQPIGEGYMATWFFGLVHEVGHLRSAASGSVPVPDRVILETLEAALEEWSHYPDALKNRALARAKAGDVRHVLSVDRLRAECQADTFAVSVLFKATSEIMRKVEHKFEIGQFIAEMHIFLNLIIILERCQRMALTANDPERRNLAAGEELALHPISYSVRARMIQLYLGYVICGILFQIDEPSTEQQSKCFGLVNDICNCMHKAVTDVDTGMAKAMRFALFPDERPTNLMSQFAHQLMTSKDSTMEIIEADKMFKVADSFGIESDSVRALQRVVQARRAQTAVT